jgi:hypothetical protein
VNAAAGEQGDWIDKGCASQPDTGDGDDLRRKEAHSNKRVIERFFR